MICKRLFLKGISGFLAVAFFVSDLAYAAPTELFSPTHGLLERILNDPSRFEVPLDFAHLKEIKKGANKSLIIHIQDAHSNLSGQENLAAALDEIMTKYGVNLVLSEGGWGDCSLTSFKKIASTEVWKRVAKKYLVAGKISGEEYLNLTSSHPMKILGLEDKALYLKSVQNYAELADRRQKILEFLNRVKMTVGKLKRKMYPLELLAYEDKKGKMSNGDAAVAVEEFLKSAESQNFDLNAFPNLKQLAMLKEKEKKIDFHLADLEQAVLLEEIQNKDGGGDLSDLFEKSRRAKNARLSQLALFQKTFQIAQSKRIPLDKFSNLAQYVAYLKNFSEIDLDKLLDEFQKAEDELFRSRLATHDSRLVRAIDRYLGLLFSAYKIQMTTKEFNLFRANEPDFGTLETLAFLNRKLVEEGYAEDILPLNNLLEDGKKYLEDFYDSVSKRDDAFVQNAERILAQENQKVAVLISGGYHTAHLKELLEPKGHSIAVLAPIVTSETNQEKYERELLSPLGRNLKKLEVSDGRIKTGALNSDGVRPMLLMVNERNLESLLQEVKPGFAPTPKPEPARKLVPADLAAARLTLEKSLEEPFSAKFRAGSAGVPPSYDGARMAGKSLVRFASFDHLGDENVVSFPVKDHAVISGPKTVHFAFLAFDRIGEMQRVLGRAIMLYFLDNLLLDLGREFLQFFIRLHGEAVRNHLMPRRFSMSFAETRPDWRERSSSSQNLGFEYSRDSNKSEKAALSKKKPSVWSPFLSDTTRTNPLSAFLGLWRRSDILTTFSFMSKEGNTMVASPTNEKYSISPTNRPFEQSIPALAAARLALEKDLDAPLSARLRSGDKNFEAPFGEDGARLAANKIGEGRTPRKSQVFLYPLNKTETSEAEAYLSKLDEEFGIWDSKAALNKTGDLMLRLSGELKGFSTAEEIPEDYVEGFLFYSVDMEILKELIRRLPADSGEVLKAVQKHTVKRSSVSADGQKKFEMFINGKGNLADISAEDLLNSFHVMNFEAKHRLFHFGLLSGLAGSQSKQQEAIKQLNEIDEAVARLARWDFVHRFEGAVGMTMLSGARDGRWDGYPVDKMGELSQNNFFTYLSNYTLNFTKGYEEDKGTVVVADVPLQSIRHTVWANFGDEKSYEAQIIVRGAVTLRKKYDAETLKSGIGPLADEWKQFAADYTHDLKIVKDLLHPKDVVFLDEPSVSNDPTAARLAVNVFQGDHRKLSPQDPAAEAYIEVCSVLAAYNAKTKERVLAHFLPTGHLGSAFNQDKARYIQTLLSDLPAGGSEANDWRFAIVSMEDANAFSVNKFSPILPSEIKGYLQYQQLKVSNLDVPIFDRDLQSDSDVASKKITLTPTGDLVVEHFNADGAFIPQSTFTLNLATAARLSIEDGARLSTASEEARRLVREAKVLLKQSYNSADAFDVMLKPLEMRASGLLRSKSLSDKAKDSLRAVNAGIKEYRMLLKRADHVLEYEYKSVGSFDRAQEKLTENFKRLWPLGKVPGIEDLEGRIRKRRGHHYGRARAKEFISAKNLTMGSKNLDEFHDALKIYETAKDTLLGRWSASYSGMAREADADVNTIQMRLEANRDLRLSDLRHRMREEKAKVLRSFDVEIFGESKKKYQALATEYEKLRSGDVPRQMVEDWKEIQQWERKLSDENKLKLRRLFTRLKTMRRIALKAKDMKIFEIARRRFDVALGQFGRLNSKKLPDGVIQTQTALDRKKESLMRKSTPNFGPTQILIVLGKRSLVFLARVRDRVWAGKVEKSGGTSLGRISSRSQTSGARLAGISPNISMQTSKGRLEEVDRYLAGFIKGIFSDRKEASFLEIGTGWPIVVPRETAKTLNRLTGKRIQITAMDILKPAKAIRFKEPREISEILIDSQGEVLMISALGLDSTEWLTQTALKERGWGLSVQRLMDGIHSGAIPADAYEAEDDPWKKAAGPNLNFVQGDYRDSNPGVEPADIVRIFNIDGPIDRAALAGLTKEGGYAVIGYSPFLRSDGLRPINKFTIYQKVNDKLMPLRHVFSGQFSAETGSALNRWIDQYRYSNSSVRGFGQDEWPHSRDINDLLGQEIINRAMANAYHRLEIQANFDLKVWFQETAARWLPEKIKKESRYLLSGSHALGLLTRMDDFLRSREGSKDGWLGRLRLKYLSWKIERRMSELTRLWLQEAARELNQDKKIQARFLPKFNSIEIIAAARLAGDVTSQDLTLQLLQLHGARLATGHSNEIIHVALERAFQTEGLDPRLVESLYLQEVIKLESLRNAENLGESAEAIAASIAKDIARVKNRKDRIARQNRTHPTGARLALIEPYRLLTHEMPHDVLALRVSEDEGGALSVATANLMIPNTSEENKAVVNQLNGTEPFDRLRRAAQWVKLYRPGIVAFQEAYETLKPQLNWRASPGTQPLNSTKYITDFAGDYGSVEAPMAQVGYLQEFLAIIYDHKRYEMLEKRVEDLGSNVKMLGLHLKQKKTGLVFWVWTTRLSGDPNQPRLEMLKAAAERFRGLTDPFVLTGDFNFSGNEEAAKADRQLNEGEVNLIDSFAEANAGLKVDTYSEHNDLRNELGLRVSKRTIEIYSTEDLRPAFAGVFDSTENPFSDHFSKVTFFHTAAPAPRSFDGGRLAGADQGNRIPSGSRSASLPTSFLGEDDSRSRLSTGQINAGSAGWTRLTTMPLVDPGRNRRVSMKSLSPERRALLVFMASLYTDPLRVPLGTTTASWPAFLRKWARSTWSDSSTRNRNLADLFGKGNEFFVLDTFDRVLEAGLDGVLVEGGIPPQDVLLGHARLEELEDDRDGYAGAFVGGPPTTYAGILDDVLLSQMRHFLSLSGGKDSINFPARQNQAALAAARLPAGQAGLARSASPQAGSSKLEAGIEGARLAKNKKSDSYEILAPYENQLALMLFPDESVNASTIFTWLKLHEKKGKKEDKETAALDLSRNEEFIKLIDQDKEHAVINLIRFQEFYGARLAQGTAGEVSLKDEKLLAIAAQSRTVSQAGAIFPFLVLTPAGARLNAVVGFVGAPHSAQGYVFYREPDPEGNLKRLGEPRVFTQAAKDAAKAFVAPARLVSAMQMKEPAVSVSPEVAEADQEARRLARLALRLYRSADVAGERDVVLKIVTANRLSEAEMNLYLKEFETLKKVAGQNVYLQFVLLGPSATPVVYGASDARDPLKGKEYGVIYISTLSEAALKAAAKEDAGFVAFPNIGEGTVLPFVAGAVFAVAAARLSRPTSWFEQLWRSLRLNPVELDPQNFKDIQVVTRPEIPRYQKLQLRAVAKIAWAKFIEYTRVALQALGSAA